MGRNVSDEWVVPLGTTHHRAVRGVGEEDRWWKQRRIDPVSLAERLWRHTQGSEPAETPQERQIKRRAAQ